MNFKCGIVGLPNVGKSTLFNALTNSNTKVANFPFCTIKPNIGIVTIPDLRINQLAKIVKPYRITPAIMEFVDIAGLVKGASKGAGLGNQFLANIRKTEAIAHVLRCFEDDNIIHITGKIDPKEDLDIINNELILSDLEICERAILRIQKHTKNNDKNIMLELSILEKCFFHLSNFAVLRTLDLSNNEKSVIRYLNFLTLKPSMYVANVHEDGFDNNPYLNKVREIAVAEGSIAVAICAKIESDMAIIKEEKDRHEFMKELNFIEPRLNCIIRAGYNLLNLQTYFTVGAKEVRAWTIPIGATALQAAGKIHSDFKRGFIRAQIISFVDFIAHNGEQGAKEFGKIRLEGRNYVVKDGDIINFLFKI